MRQPRAVPWLAAPAAYLAALAVLAGAGRALEAALHYRDNWQVNTPAIAGLTAILLLAPSSPTQPKARNAWAAALLGLAVVAAGYGLAVARHQPGTMYPATGFLTAAAGALGGCVAFTALTRVRHWTVDTPATATPTAELDGRDATDRGATDGDAAQGTDAASVDPD